jgi:hypothetical protein
MGDIVKLTLGLWPQDSSFYYKTSQPVVSKYKVAGYKARLFLITNFQLLFTLYISLYLVCEQKKYDL